MPILQETTSKGEILFRKMYPKRLLPQAQIKSRKRKRNIQPNKNRIILLEVPTNSHKETHDTLLS